MNKGVEQLAAHFNVKPDVIEAGLKEESNLDSVFEAYDKTVQIFTHEELTKKLENFAKDEIDKLGADGQQVPSKLYNRIKGNAFEKKEKELAKKYEVAEWDGMDDLQDKIVTKVKAKSGKADDENLTEIDRLKKLVLDTEKEKGDVVEAAKAEFHEQLIQRDVDITLGRIHIDEEGEKLENQHAILKAVVKGELTFKYIEGKTVAFKGEEMQKNKVGDPQSLEEVLVPFAEKYVNVKKVPDGGRGANSTDDTKTGIKGLKSREDFYEHVEAEEIEEGTEAYLKVMTEFNEANPEINI